MPVLRRVTVPSPAVDPIPSGATGVGDGLGGGVDPSWERIGKAPSEFAEALPPGRPTILLLLC